MSTTATAPRLLGPPADPGQLESVAALAARLGLHPDTGPRRRWGVPLAEVSAPEAEALLAALTARAEAPASPEADTRWTPLARACEAPANVEGTRNDTPWYTSRSHTREASSAPTVAPALPCGWPIPGDDGRAATPKQAAALRYLAGPGAGRTAVDVVATIRRHVGKQRPEELTRAEASWLLDTVRLGERAPAEEGRP